MQKDFNYSDEPIVLFFICLLCEFMKKEWNEAKHRNISCTLTKCRTKNRTVFASACRGGGGGGRGGGGKSSHQK